MYVWGVDVQIVSIDSCQCTDFRETGPACCSGAHDSRRFWTQRSVTDTLLHARTTCFMYESLEHYAGHIQRATTCPRILETLEACHKVR